MRARAIFLLAIGLLLCACVYDRAPEAMTRDLSPAEKTMLAHSLTSTLKDPDSAKFDWVPVKYVPGAFKIDYCGRLNAKNADGVYSGFKNFHAILNRDDTGQFSTGRIDAEDAQEQCAKTGYTDFSQAK
jgi:hypothetical protein